MKSQLKISFLLLLVIGLVKSQTFYNLKEHDFELEFGIHSNNLEEESEDSQELELAENEINEQNEKFLHGEANFFEKITENSDMPREMVEKDREGAVIDKGSSSRGMGLILDPENQGFTHPQLQDLIANRVAENRDSYDATTLNLVTSIKNQGQCGSCADFSTTSVHETSMLKQGANISDLDLSEQQLLDCGYGTSTYLNGCNGADPYYYGLYFVNTMGGQAVHEYTYPYLGTKSQYQCPTNVTSFNSGAKVTNAMVDYKCNESNLLTYVSTYGSAVSTIYASDTAFSNYAGGVFDSCTNTTANHAITVVGYGTDTTSGDYWLIKNSWGKSWGLSGYLKLKRGSSTCGIGSYCYSASAVTNGTPNSAPTLPTASTCDLTSVYGNLTGSFYTYLTGSKFAVTCTSGVCKPYSGTYTNACWSICNLIYCYALGK